GPAPRRREPALRGRCRRGARPDAARRARPHGRARGRGTGPRARLPRPDRARAARPGGGVKAWLLARKDLQVYFRDRVAVLLGFGLPVALCTVFAGAMGAIGGSGSMGRILVVVEDADRSDASRDLVASLEKCDGLRLDVLTGDELGAGKHARDPVAEGD